MAGDLVEAHRHLGQAWAIFRELGALSPMPVCHLGWIHLCRGELDAADAAFTEALHGAEVQRLRRVASYVILALACSAAAQRDWERAACLLGFADGELQCCGVSWPVPERAYRQQSLRDVERQLGAGFEGNYDSGRTGDRGDLIDFALRQ